MFGYSDTRFGFFPFCLASESIYSEFHSSYARPADSVPHSMLSGIATAQFLLVSSCASPSAAVNNCR